MADFDQVPVVEVHKDNFKELWPSLVLSVHQATFIAIDTELSGLGNRKRLNAKDLDDRYHYMCEVARTRSVVSLGLSCFKVLPTSPVSTGDRTEVKNSYTKGNVHKLQFQIQTYNIMMLCDDEYIVEPLSLRFLVEHGFDFNKQYAGGLPYHRGNDKPTEGNEPSIRRLFCEIILSKAPVVLHNAVVDLVFLYHSLYCSLPTTQQAFLADLAEMFPAGVFDTKYITDFKARMGASYLEFVFRKCQRENIESQRQGWSHIITSFIDYGQITKNVVYQACGLPNLSSMANLTVDALCIQYANHGWCPDGSDCGKSHDIDLILETQLQGTPARRRKKQRRDKERTSKDDGVACSNGAFISVSCDKTNDKSNPIPFTKEATEESSQIAPAQDTLICSAGCHRAGFDAFMTGFIYGFFSARYGNPATDTEASDYKGQQLGMEDYKNKVYLVGKDIPLTIMKSSFSKCSKDHRTKFKKLDNITYPVAHVV